MASLTRSDVNSGSAVDLGSITSEIRSKESGFIILPLPLSDSDQADILDFEGAQKTITIRGIITGTDSQLRTARDNLEAFIDGDQINTTTYANSKSNSSDLNVKIKRAESTFNSGRVSEIEYVIIMVEAAQ